MHPGWTLPYWNDDIERWQTDQLFASDALLLGRSPSTRSSPRAAAVARRVHRLDEQPAQFQVSSRSAAPSAEARAREPSDAGIAAPLRAPAGRPNVPELRRQVAVHAHGQSWRFCCKRDRGVVGRQPHPNVRTELRRSCRARRSRAGDLLRRRLVLAASGRVACRSPTRGRTVDDPAEPPAVLVRNGRGFLGAGADGLSCNRMCSSTR